MSQRHALPAVLWNDFTASLDTRLRRVTFWLLMACALALRLVYLGQDIRFDEGWTYVNYATRSFGDIMTSYGCTNNHILHTLLVAAVTKVFGGSPEVIRLPALFFGLLMLPLVHVVAAKIYGRNAAFVATALTAASSCLIEYSANGRGYTMLVDLTLLSLYAALLLKRDNRLSLWLTFGLLGALGFFVSPIMLYGFGSVALYLFVSILAGDVAAPRRRTIPRLALACGFGALLTAAFYASGFACSTVMNQSHLQPLPWARLWVGYLHPYHASLILWTRDMPVPVAAVLVALCAVSVALHRRLAGDRVPVAVCGLVWPVIVGVFYHVVPITRSLLYALPLCLVALSGTVPLLGRLLPSSGAMARLSCLLSLAVTLGLGGCVLARDSITTSEQTGLGLGAREAAAYIAANYAMTDGMAFSVPAVGPIEYYLYRDDVPYRWLKGKARKTMWVVCNTVEGEDPPVAALREYGIDCPFSILDSRTFRMVQVYRVRLDCPAP